MAQGPPSRGSYTPAGLLRPRLLRPRLLCPRLLLLLVHLLNSCYLDQDSGRTGLAGARFGYRAVCGEVFVMQCASPCSSRLYNGSAHATWFRLNEDGRPTGVADVRGSVVVRGNALWFFAVGVKDSGRYMCQTGLEQLVLDLVVEERGVLVCGDSEESSVELVRLKEGSVYCPELERPFSLDPNTPGNRTSDLDPNTPGNRTSDLEHNTPGNRTSCQTCTPVCWYKNARSLDELKHTKVFSVTADGHELRLNEVHKTDETVFFCDRHTHDQHGLSWTMRRAVNVTVRVPDTEDPPRILHPYGNEAEVEVELGQNYTLTCEVQFGFQKNSSLLLQWWQRDDNHDNQEPGGVLMEMESQEQVTVRLTEVNVKRKSIIPQVTQQHLSSSFTCLASSSLGNHSATLRLVLRPPARSSVGMVTAVVLVLLLASVAATAHIYWLEISLLYRTYQPHTHTLTDGKLFDAFVSYVSSSVSEEGQEEGTAETSLSVQLRGVSVPQPEGLSAGAGVSDEALELQLPRVLEGWGYRLCLLERDVLPGGAYTEDVMYAVRSSRRLLCLLSPAYLSSPNGVFELEAGLRTLLQDPQLRVVLIWALRPPSLGQLDPPLPPLVLRALRVLPALDWAPGWDRSGPGFWRTLRAAMPPLPHTDS